MQPVTLTPIFSRIFEAMNRRDLATAWIVDGCAPTAHDAISLQVDVAAGHFLVAGGTFATYAGGNITLDAADPFAPRVDLVYFSAGGVLSKATGVPALLNPVPLALPANAALIAICWVPATNTNLVTGGAFVEDCTMPNVPPFLPAGTFGAPSLPFGDEKTLGLYRVGAGVLGVTGSLAIGNTPAASGITRVPNNAAHAGRNNANSGDILIAYVATNDEVRLRNDDLRVGASYISVAATPATAGTIRVPSGGNMFNSRNAANSGNIIVLDKDGSNNLYLGDTGGSNNPLVRLAAAGATQVEIGSGYLSVGATPATAGSIRLTNNTTVQERNAANSANISLIGLDGSNNVLLAPITTAGDLIIGGASGIATRLAIGSNTNVLTVSGGAPVWAAAGGITADKGNWSDTTTVVGASATLTKTITVASGRVLCRTGITSTTGGTGDIVLAFGGTATGDAYGSGNTGTRVGGIRAYDADMTRGGHFGGSGRLSLQDFYINGTSLTWVFKEVPGVGDTMGGQAEGHAW